MAFQWLQMRISEEVDRRKREAGILERLPRALDEFHDALKTCVEGYQDAFGAETSDLQKSAGRIRVTMRDGQSGKVQPSACVDITTVTSIPGFEIDRGGGEPLIIEVGVLPGDKLCYRDRAKD